MKFLHSIRGRLLLWYGLLLAAMLAGFGSTAWHLVRTSLLARVDQNLQRRISVITSALKAFRAPEPDKPPRVLADLHLTPAEAALFDSADTGGYYYAVWLRGAAPAVRSANAPLDVSRPGIREASPRERDSLREAFLFAAPVDCVLVGRSMGDDLGTLHRVAWVLALAGGGVLVLGLTGGWWLTSRALRPVHDISQAANRIAGGDLSKRINTSQTESELGELALLLNATFARLESAFAQQARFTSDAAHELRTPLSVLLMQTQVALSRERSAGEYRDALCSSQATAQRMRRLIESLLELARLDAGQEPLRRMPCDISVIAADCLELMRPLADARGITIDLDLAEAPCEADPERIAQVITNLLKNAIDYNREPAKVSMTAAQHHGAVSLTVSDTGVGIPAAHLPHLFERFYRADTSRSDSATRSGLGLAIAKAIVEAHGGTLAVESKLGVGTTFLMRLPGIGEGP